MRLKHKVVTGFSLIILVVIFLTGIAVKNNAQVVTLYENLNDKSFQLVQIVKELTYVTMERKASVRGYLLMGDIDDLIVYDENEGRFNSLIAQAKRLTRDNEKYSQSIRYYERLVQDWERLIAEPRINLRQYLAYQLIDKDQYMHSLVETSYIERQLLGELRYVEFMLISIAEKEMSDRHATVRRVGNRNEKFLIFLGLGSLVAGSLFGLVVSKHITAPLEMIVSVAYKICQGDLSQRIVLDNRRDEVGTLARSLNQMIETIEKSTRELEESEQKYATLVQKAHDGIGIVQGKKLVFVNQKFIEITGYSFDELIGMAYMQIIPAQRVRQTDKGAGEDPLPLDTDPVFENEIVTKNGQKRILEVNTGVIEYRNEEALLVVIRDITRRRRYAQDLKLLSERITSTQEEERKRISRELHDEIGQALFAINLHVEAMEEERATGMAVGKKKFKDIRKLVEKTIDDVHRISYDLRPPLLDDIGLSSALIWYAETVQERTGIAIALQINGRERKIDPAIETLIYRIMQEALTNVSKHAEATRVDAVVGYHPGRVTVSIVDDGIGFTVRDVIKTDHFTHGGLGLFGIRERLYAFNGKLKITSEMGAGTTLSIEIPVG